MDPLIASPPSAWAEAERAFHLTYQAGADSLPRRAVRVTWTTRRLGDRGGFLLSALREGSGAHDGVEVTVAPAAEPGRSMVFSIDPGPTPLRPEGATAGVLVGGFGSNAVCCLEVDGRVVWPTMNPVERAVR